MLNALLVKPKVIKLNDYDVLVQVIAFAIMSGGGKLINAAEPLNLDVNNLTDFWTDVNTGREINIEIDLQPFILRQITITIQNVCKVYSVSRVGDAVTRYVAGICFDGMLLDEGAGFEFRVVIDHDGVFVKSTPIAVSP